MRKTKKNAFPPIHVIVQQEGEESRERVFVDSFVVGRDADCNLIVQDGHVSRHHIRVEYKDECWWVHDLDSTNGVYLNEKKVVHAPVLDRDVLILGQNGPRLIVNYINEAEAAAIEAEHIEEGTKTGKKRMLVFMGAIILLGAIGFFYGKNEVRQQERFRERALTLYEEIRATNMAIAMAHVEDGADRLSKAQKIIELQKSRKEDLEAYRGYLIRLGFYGDIEDQVERKIYSTSYLFSENELILPEAFVQDVAESIRQYWLNERLKMFETALKRADALKYDSYILKTLDEFGLPAEFFYLPLTISGFGSEKDLLSETGQRAGIWKLSTASGERYGLEIGENSERNASSAVDERYEALKATQAAVRMLHDIYREEAYASGLLTLALFLQYQENQASGNDMDVGAILADVPADMKSRNLWHIRDTYPYRISDEVYDRVVQIFSAAVISQDPQSFDLDFSTPTATNMSTNIYRSFR